MTLTFRLTVATALTAAFVSAQEPAQPDPQQPSPEEAQLNASLAEKHQQLTQMRLDLLRPIKVNGEEVSVERFKRDAVFLAAGKQVQSHVANFLVEDQIEEQVAAGRDPAEFEVSDDEIVEEVKNMLAAFQQENPGIDLWEVVRSQYGMDRETYIRQSKATKRFDRTFFPGPAANWPLISKEAIMASAQQGSGQQFWENVVTASTDEDGNARQLPPFWLQLCRNWVTKQLIAWSDIRFPADGLPADICLSVNDRTLATEDAFEQIKSGLFSQDLERSVTETLLCEALRQELVKVGAYMSDEDFQKAFEEFRAEYDSSVFTTEVVATAFKGYPSLEAFRQRWRLITSYERMIESEINDDNLQAYADMRAGFFGDGRLNADVIQIFGRDYKTGAWMNNGMVRAKRLADEAMAKLQDGADFDAVMAEYGEYYATDKDKGHFAAKAMNQTRQAMREAEYTDLSLGYSVALHLFFDAEVGTIVGPLRGADAYYIARINGRIPPSSAPSVADERMRDLVRQDYVVYRFMEWANEVAARSTFE